MGRLRKCGKKTGTLFFSSRRRHTRSLCDWSSDVCSSDHELQSHSDLVCRLLLDWSSRSEEHTSELQSHSDLVCRLLLEKKKKKKKKNNQKENTRIIELH